MSVAEAVGRAQQRGDVVSALNVVALGLFVVLFLAGLRRVPVSYSLYVLPQLALIVWRAPAITLMSTMRYCLVLFPCFVVLALVGRHRRFHEAWVVLSVLFLGLLTRCSSRAGSSAEDGRARRAAQGSGGSKPLRCWRKRSIRGSPSVPTTPTESAGPEPEAAADPTLRGAVRRAVARAWARAIASGALPALDPATEGPEVRVERPANPEHGDAATNLAMRLARPYRRAPLEIAGALAEELAREIADSPATTPLASVAVAAPGFVNVRYADRALPGRGRGDPSRCGSLGLGSGAGRRPASRERRVRLGQPDRSADDRQRPRGLRRRPALPGPRGRRAAGHPRVLLQRFRDPGLEAGRERHRDPPRRAGPRGRLPRRVRRRAGRRRCPTRSGPRRPEPSADATGIVGRWASERVRAGIEASLAHLGVRFDVWTTERSLHDEGWVEPGRRAAARGRSRLRAGRRPVVPLDGLRRRQGPGDHPVERRADLLRLGHRLPDREVQPGLRRARLHLGPGPSRHGGPGPQRRRGDGLRQGGRPDAPGRLGPLRPRRRRGLDEQAGRDVHHPRRAPGRDRRRRRPLVLRVTESGIGDRLRHRAGEEAVEREPGLLRPVRPRPDRLDPAQGGGGRSRPGSDPGRRRARRRPGGRPRPRGHPSARGGRGRGGRGGGPGDHRLRHRAGDHVPRLLSRREGRGSRGSGPFGGPAGPRRRDPDHPRQCARPAGDLGARSRCSRAGSRRRSARMRSDRQPARPRAPGQRLDRGVVGGHEEGHPVRSVEVDEGVPVGQLAPASSRPRRRTRSRRRRCPSGCR